MSSWFLSVKAGLDGGRLEESDQELSQEAPCQAKKRSRHARHAVAASPGARFAEQTAVSSRTGKGDRRFLEPAGGDGGQKVYSDKWNGRLPH